MTGKIIQVFGSDGYIARRAKVSTDRDAEELNVKKFIDFLIRNEHFSPFEFAHLDIELNVPIWALRQIFRHKGAKIEKSRRYTKDLPEIESGIGVSENEIIEEYNKLLEVGSKPEQARKILPMGTYTRAIWQPNVRDFLFTCRSRISAAAQIEVRNLFEDLFVQFALEFPSTSYSFLIYHMGTKPFSVLETKEVLNNVQARNTLVEGLLDRIIKEIPISQESSEEAEHFIQDDI